MSKNAITFRQFLSRRGYDLGGGSREFLSRALLSPWAQPGFHRFWRLWNPLYGFLLFRLYVLLGGNRRRVSSTLAVFAVCGLVLHDLPVGAILGRVQVTLTVSFLFFGLASLLSSRLERSLPMGTWPRAVHISLNLGLITGGLLLGALVQGRLFPGV